VRHEYTTLVTAARGAGNPTARAARFMTAYAGSPAVLRLPGAARTPGRATWLPSRRATCPSRSGEDHAGQSARGTRYDDSADRRRPSSLVGRTVLPAIGRGKSTALQRADGPLRPRPQARVVPFLSFSGNDRPGRAKKKEVVRHLEARCKPTPLTPASRPGERIYCGRVRLCDSRASMRSGTSLARAAAGHRAVVLHAYPGVQGPGHVPG